MELTNKLIGLLNQYIEQYKKLKEEHYQHRMNQTLYEELLLTLSQDNPEENKMSISILLDTIYGNGIYVNEFYRISWQPDNKEALNQFISRINTDYVNLKSKVRELKARIDRSFAMFQSAKRVMYCLKHQVPISKSQNDVFNVKKIINYYEISGTISNKEELLLINAIELHNRNVGVRGTTLGEEKTYANHLYNEIPNILTIGFQEHDEIEVSKGRKTSLDKFANEIINLINQIDNEEIDELLESYKKYDLDHNEYNYIIVKILDNYLEELITLYELLIEKDVYIHRTGRIDVIKNYYQTLDKYLSIREYYTKTNEYVDEPEETIEEVATIEQHEEKRLIYSRSTANITKAKIISDMSDIPYEYYDNIYDLLLKFKQGKLGNKRIKTIMDGSKNQGHIELKDDSIRIVLKRVQENIYNVLGVMIKKANNDMWGYRTLMNRMTPDISTEEKLNQQLELAAMTEQELSSLVQEKARKNGRK